MIKNNKFNIKEWAYQRLLYADKTIKSLKIEMDKAVTSGITELELSDLNAKVEKADSEYRQAHEAWLKAENEYSEYLRAQIDKQNTEGKRIKDVKP